MSFDAQVDVEASVNFTSQQGSFVVPGSMLRPVQLRGFRSNNFVLRDGFPFVPELWVQCNTSVSSTGEYLSGDREDAFDVEIPVHTRFIATDSTWDEIAFVWSPWVTRGVDYSFAGAALTSPIMDFVTYRVGKEIIVKPSFQFTPGDFLTSDFNNNFDDALQFSIGMVLLLHPGSYGILGGPVGETKFQLTTDGTLINFDVNGVTGQARNTIPASGLTPCYLVLSVDSETVSISVGSSPNNMATGALSADVATTSMIFTLGKDWAGNNAPSFYLLEWALWDYALTASNGLSINQLVALWSSIYGAGNG